MNIEIGAKIKQLRNAAGMTQEQLGNELSVSAQAVSKWESGTTTPDIQLLPEISVLFGVTIDELFSMTDERKTERIENMIDNMHFIPEKDFSDSEKFLREKLSDEKAKAKATLVLGELYSKRASEYNEIALKCEEKQLIEYIKIFSSIEAELKFSLSPRILLETATLIAISDDEDLKKN